MKLSSFLRSIGAIGIGVVMALSLCLSSMDAKAIDAKSVAVQAIEMPAVVPSAGGLSEEITAAPVAAMVVRAEAGMDCDLKSADVRTYSGGTVSYCRKRHFESAENDSALVDLLPGAARAPHWHNVWEQQYLLSGTAKTYVFDTDGSLRVIDMKPGMVSFLPAGAPHWSEVVGPDPARFLFIFPTGFRTYALADAMVGVSPAVMDSVMGVTMPRQIKNRDALVMVRQ